METAFRETLHCCERVDGNNTARSLMLFGTYSAINMFQILSGRLAGRFYVISRVPNWGRFSLKHVQKIALVVDPLPL